MAGDERDDRGGEDRSAPAEEQEAIGEERARTIAEHAAALLFEIDARGRTSYVGAGCFEILGYTQEELKSIPLLDLVHPEDRERVAREYRSVDQLGTVMTEHRGLHKDGSWRCLQDTVRAYQTPDGERRFVVIGRDVTQQKKLEAALERQAVVQHEIAELSRHFLALETDDVDSQVRNQLELAARLAGATRTHLLMLEPERAGIRAAYTWSAPGAPEDPARDDAEALERFRWSLRTLTRGDTINAPSPDALPREAQGEAADMRDRGVHGLLALPIRVGGSVIGCQLFETFEPRPAWTPQELTELRMVGEIFASAIQRKNAAREMERRRSDEAQVAALSRRFLGLAVDKTDRAIEQALEGSARPSRALRAVLECFSPELGSGRKIYEWCASAAPPGAQEDMGWLRAALRRGETLRVSNVDELPFEAAMERRSLRARGVGSLLCLPILSGSDAIGSLRFEWGEQRSWTEHDVTMLRLTGEIFTTALRRRHAEEALRESRAQLLQAHKLEAVGRLAGGIAHDFNNLLTVILGFSRPLLEQLEPGEIRDDVNEIQEAAERAAGLTKQLLTFSRRQQASTQRIELNATIVRLEGLLRPLLGDDVGLLCELDPSVGWIQVDSHQLEQVVMNLAVNARDAMPDGGTLRLSTSVQELDESEALRLGAAGPGPHAVLTAADTGCGMDEETRAHVFDPFFTTKEQGKGTGLGLSIVYGVVEQAGGAIAVSGAISKGTKFEIFLPRVAEGDVDVNVAAPPAPARGEAHVLVVDDEPSVRRVARRLLEREGYEVSEAPDGETAIHLCSMGSSPPDVVLTDCVMARLSGMELAKRIRYLLPDARIILMSGYPSEETVLPDLPEPPTFLQKPFSAAELSARIAEVLGND